MGFSLEALIAVPCCLSLLVHAAGLAGPVAGKVKRAGNIAAYSASRKSESGYTCRHTTISHKSSTIPCVETCPQKVVEVLSLARDTIRQLNPGQQESNQP